MSDPRKHPATNGRYGRGTGSGQQRPPRNFGERFFPGPTPQMPDHVAERIDRLLRPLDGATSAVGATPADASATAPAETAPEPVTAAPADPEAWARLHAQVDEQTELLRAILASSVDSQEDARATAQNSRTFAWAGTAIAVLTLAATVISLVAAVTGR